MGNYISFRDTDTCKSNPSAPYTYDLQDERAEQKIINSTYKKNWYFYFGNRYDEDTIELDDD